MQISQRVQSIVHIEYQPIYFMRFFVFYPRQNILFFKQPFNFEQIFFKTLLKTLTNYLSKKLIMLQEEKSITEILNMKALQQFFLW